jgi:hypothetical protein
MKQNELPSGWDEERVRQILTHYENQSEEEAIDEDTLSIISQQNEPTKDYETFREELRKEGKLR